MERITGKKTRELVARLVNEAAPKLARKLADQVYDPRVTGLSSATATFTPVRDRADMTRIADGSTAGWEDAGIGVGVGADPLRAAVQARMGPGVEVSMPRISERFG